MRCAHVPQRGRRRCSFSASRAHGSQQNASIKTRWEDTISRITPKSEQATFCMEACRLSEKRFARWTQDWQDLMILVSLGGNNETVARFQLRVIRRGADGALYELSFRSVRGLRLGRIWRNRFAFVEAGPVVEGGEGAGYHAVNVEGAAEMVDFVLKNAGVPARGLNELGFGACVEILDADGAGAGHDGGKSGEAKAAFVEISLFVAFVGDHWIDDDVKWDRAALAFAE